MTHQIDVALIGPGRWGKRLAAVRQAPSLRLVTPAEIDDTGVALLEFARCILDETRPESGPRKLWPRWT